MGMSESKNFLLKSWCPLCLHEERLQQDWVVKITYDSIIEGRYSSLTQVLRTRRLMLITLKLKIYFVGQANQMSRQDMVQRQLAGYTPVRFLHSPWWSRLSSTVYGFDQQGWYGMFVACWIWCLADVSSVSPSSEQTAYSPTQKNSFFFQN